MTIFYCIRCGYNTDHRSHMKNHLSRKTMCDPNESNILLNNELKNDILHVCNYCLSSYAKKEDHELSCAKKIEYDEKQEIKKVREELEKLRKEIDDMKKNKQIINIETQNNQIINNQYNIDIKLLPYDEFTSRHIDRKWLFNNIIENQHEVPKILVNFFGGVFLNEDNPENHSIFCICMKKNQIDIFVHTDQHILKELSVEEFYNFIDNDVKARIKYLLADREKFFLTDNYENLPESEKSQISEEDYIDIKNSLLDFLYSKTKEFPEILEILKNNNIPQYTIAELHKQKNILMPSKAKKYIEYIGN
jgi:hypothetical protein